MQRYIVLRHGFCHVVNQAEIHLTHVYSAPYFALAHQKAKSFLFSIFIVVVSVCLYVFYTLM